MCDILFSLKTYSNVRACVHLSKMFFSQGRKQKNPIPAEWQVSHLNQGPKRLHIDPEGETFTRHAAITFSLSHVLSTETLIGCLRATDWSNTDKQLHDGLKFRQTDVRKSRQESNMRNCFSVCRQAERTTSMIRRGVIMKVFHWIFREHESRFIHVKQYYSLKTARLFLD